MNTRRNRRIQTSELFSDTHEGIAAYWGNYARYSGGRMVYYVPYGVVWKLSRIAS